MKFELQPVHAADAPTTQAEVQSLPNPKSSANQPQSRQLKVFLSDEASGQRTYHVEAASRPDGSLALRIIDPGTGESRPVVLTTSRTLEAASNAPLQHLAHKHTRTSVRVTDAGQGKKRKGSRGGADDHGALTSSMPGQVLKVLVSEGQEVSKGQTLVVIEAMKMEHEVKAPNAGRVKKLSCTAGAMVSPGVPLVELETLEASAGQ